MDNLDEILNGDEHIEPVAAEEPQPEVTPEEPEAEAKAERPRGPDGKFVSKGETPEAPAPEASPAPEEPQLDHAALIGERRRRQEAEDRLRALEAQLQQPQPQFQPPAQAPDMFEDPEGYTRYISAQAAEAARAQAYEQFQYQRIEMAATQFAPTVPDYAEKVQVFQQMVSNNPALLQELYRAPNPAEYAYNTAKTQIEISQYGGLEGLIKARVEEALKAQAPAPEPTPAPPIPDTLAAEQSARTSAAGYQPPSLEDILRG